MYRLSIATPVGVCIGLDSILCEEVSVFVFGGVGVGPVESRSHCVRWKPNLVYVEAREK